MRTRGAAYGEDLAFVHHVGFTDFARRMGRPVLRLLRENGLSDGRVVDLGCGTGVWARMLTDAGFDVLGIDVSAAMLARARRTAPRARFVRGSFFRATLPPCRAVTALGECVSYAFDPRAGSRALARLFGRVHAALEPGGLFVFDVIETAGLAPGETRRTSAAGEGWATLVATTEDRPRRRLVRRITILRRIGRRWRRATEVHPLRLYDRGALRRMLARAGFAVRVRVRLDGERMLPGRVAFVARKRPAGRR